MIFIEIKKRFPEFLSKFDLTNEQIKKYVGKGIEYFTKAELRAFSIVNTNRRGEEAARVLFENPQTNQRISREGQETTRFRIDQAKFIG